MEVCSSQFVPTQLQINQSNIGTETGTIIDFVASFSKDSFCNILYYSTLTEVALHFLHRGPQFICVRFRPNRVQVIGPPSAFILGANSSARCPRPSLGWMFVLVLRWLIHTLFDNSADIKFI